MKTGAFIPALYLINLVVFRPTILFPNVLLFSQRNNGDSELSISNNESGMMIHAQNYRGETDANHRSFSREYWR